MDGGVLPPVASLMGKLAHENAPNTTSDPPGEGALTLSHSSGSGRVMARRTSAAPLSPCTTRHSVPTRRAGCPAMKEREGESRGGQEVKGGWLEMFSG